MAFPNLYRCAPMKKQVTHGYGAKPQATARSLSEGLCKCHNMRNIFEGTLGPAPPRRIL